MSNEAIGAQAHGGEVGSIAVVSPSPLRASDPIPPATAAMAMEPTATTSDAAAPGPLSGAHSGVVSDTLPDADAAPPPLGPQSSLDSSSSSGAMGLHSPPESNIAKADGSSSDSELSYLDDDVLVDTDTYGTAPLDNNSHGAATAASATTSANCVVDAATAAAAGPLDSATSAPDEAAEVDDIGDIEPAFYSGTVPVFRPTMHQFRDFKKFMEKINSYGMKSGIVKVIPPQEWKDSLGPLDDKVKSIKVREPIKQDIMGTNGTYRQVNILHQRTYNLPQWRQLCDQSEHQPPARRGERRANADKPRAPARARATGSAAATGAGKTSAASGHASTTKKGKKGRPGRKGSRRHGADDDTASAMSEPRLITPESQRGDEDKMVVDDDKTCVETPQDADKATEDKTEDAMAVMSSVEVEIPIKKEEEEEGIGDVDEVEDDEDEDDDACTVDSAMTEISAAPRRMGFSRQAIKRAQSTSARRKYTKREGSAQIDDAAFKDWDYRMDVSDYTPERCEELERIYWKTLTYAPPLYGADLPGTLFDESTDIWNLNKLPNLLDVLGTKVPGVNTAYLYLGMWKATFAWHLEDVDLYSINYLHFGAPKQWYSISQGDARRFEAVMKNVWSADAKACDQFLRHKAFLISPSHLQNHYNIRVNKCVSYPGEFVVTYPYGYHSGYNLGYNCAEAVNFALESWLPMGKIAKKCECAQAQDSVWVDVYEIERKLRGISTEDEDDSDMDDDDDESDDDLEDMHGVEDDSNAGLPTPPSGAKSVRVRVPAGGKRGRGASKTAQKRKRPRADVDEVDKEDRRRQKKMRLRMWSSESAPCCLCPNNMPDFDLLPTDDGLKAHRMCARYLPETYIENIDGTEVVTNLNKIPLSRLELRCVYCRMRKGVCLQCSYGKCSRSYHATCAAAAGVFVEEVDVPVFGDDGTEYKERTFEFTCRFQRTKRDKRLDSSALEKSERTRAAAASLQEGAICQMQLYRSDIFAGIVVENRSDEEMVLLRTIPTGDVVEVDWKWLLLPDTMDYRQRKASANALPLPKSRKEVEELNVKKQPYPVADDVFVEGYTWKEFRIYDGPAATPSPAAQPKVDSGKPNPFWYYIGKPSTDSKAQYTDNPSNPVHNPRSNFLESVPKANQSAPPQTSMLPPKRPAVASMPAKSTPAMPTPVTSTPAPIPAHALEQPLPPPPANALYISGQTAAAQPGAQPSAEPRRSYSVIKPPYVPHTSPTTSASPASPAPPAAAATAATTATAVATVASVSTPFSASSTPSSVSSIDVSANKIQKTPDGFVQPQRPASKHQPSGHRHHQHSSSHRSPFGPVFSMPKSGSSGSKFPQIQHPNLSHGYATVPAPKPPSAAGGAMSPPSTSGVAGGDASFSPRAVGSQTSKKFPFFQVHGNRDASTYRSPYLAHGGFSNAQENSYRARNVSRGARLSRTRKSSSGAATLAAAAAKLHKRSASSTSSISSFGLGGGLRGLSHPSPHTNYVGLPPPPSSTASSPFMTGHNLNYTRPGSSVSSYASYEPLMGGGAGMSPHSPVAVDASPFIGSPGPQMGSFDDPATMSYQHPGLRPQFGSSWQQSFQNTLASFSQDMELNFSPPSPMSSVMSMGLTGGGLGAPANIFPSHQPSYSFGGAGSLGVDSMMPSVLGGFESMSPPQVAESPMAMSPTMELDMPLDVGTDQSPADQLKQQLRSISDSSLPSSYRLRCLHQPRRRHQSRSSLNRIFTSQLLDLNPT